MNYHDEFDKPILKARVASHKTTFFGRDFKFLVLYEDELMRLPHSRYLSDGGGGFVNPL